MKQLLRIEIYLLSPLPQIKTPFYVYQHKSFVQDTLPLPLGGKHSMSCCLVQTKQQKNNHKKVTFSIHSLANKVHCAKYTMNALVGRLLYNSEYQQKKRDNIT